MQRKKTPLIIGAVLVALLVIGGIFVLTNKKSTPVVEETTTKRRISEPVNVIPVNERPYIKLVPLADGRNVEIRVETLNKPASAMDYELEYQAGSLLQGAFGQIDLASIPASTKILFGSCSAGGACTYHTDIKGGTLLTRFTASENYALKSDWKYIDNSTKETEFSSKDAKFQISSKDLAKQRFMIIFNAPGYPSGLKGQVVSDPYSLESSSTLQGKATLTMRANEEGELVIMGYNGAWQEFTGKVDGKMIEAEVQLMPLYVVVKK